MVNDRCIWIHRTVRYQWFVISEMVSYLVAIEGFEFVLWVVPLAERSGSLAAGHEWVLGVKLVVLLFCEYLLIVLSVSLAVDSVGCVSVISVWRSLWSWRRDMYVIGWW